MIKSTKKYSEKQTEGIGNRIAITNYNFKRKKKKQGVVKIRLKRWGENHLFHTRNH